jgi:hypothetical protein
MVAEKVGTGHAVDLPQSLDLGVPNGPQPQQLNFLGRGCFRADKNLVRTRKGKAAIHISIQGHHSRENVV